MVLISHVYKFIFFKTRKTAGTSVEAALQRLIGGEATEVQSEQALSDGIVGTRMGGAYMSREERRALDRRLHRGSVGPRGRGRRGQPPKHYHKPRAVWYNHKPAREVLRDLGAHRFGKYFKFTIVRNPWDKVVSLWKWQRKRGKIPDKLSFKRFALRLRYSDDWHIHTLDNRRICDAYIRYESLEEDLGRVLGKLGVPDDLIRDVLEHLPHYKAGDEVDEPLTYRKYYGDDEDLIAHVGRVYRREVSFFSYRF